MTRLRRQRALLGLCGAFAAAAGAADLDVNRDGLIRVALVSPATHAGGVSADVIGQDLAAAVQAGRTGKPVRVVAVPVAPSKTLFGWWYHPDSRAGREQLLAGAYDHVLLAESEEFARGYPELFFEGVRAASAAFGARGARVTLVLLAKPASTFRDRRAAALAETGYRVGDGCGVPVVPAAYAWMEALQHNRIAGDTPVKTRAYAYLAAASIYCELADARLPKGALETDWTTKKTTEVLALSAREAMLRARVEKHYAGPFAGVVRAEPRLKKRLKIYTASAADDDPVRANLQYILDAAFQDWFWRTPADWYTNGFDRSACAFDLVYADTRQMDQYLDPESYGAGAGGAARQPPPCVCVFCRNPEAGPQGGEVLRALEPLLIEGYDYAKAKGLAFVPYQVAWARAWQESPALVAEAAPGRGNDWLSYMLANMLYTMVTDRYQPPPEKEKPRLASADHPHGFHERCARIGYDTVRQLSRLSLRQNAVVLKTETYRIDAESPGFASVRLLDRPAADVRVFCATDVPGAAALSREALVFTPETFDIEQSVRVLPATNRPTLFFNFMVGAQSDDPAVDGAGDARPFLLNYDESEAVSFAFARDVLSPEAGYEVPLAPGQRPSDLVCASVIQRGQVTEDVYFTHDLYGPQPVRLYPSAADYEKGLMRVTVATRSTDRRFNGRVFEYAFRVSAQGRAVPRLAIAAPAAGAALEGPAFVTARAAAEPAADVSEVAVHLGSKRLGRAAGAACSAAVEQGPPQSRLACGDYVLWASARSSAGVVVATEPHPFSVREAPSRALR